MTVRFLGKRALRKSLRPDGFLRKSERKKSHLLEVTTTVIEACQAVALEKDDQIVYTSTTAETDAAVSTLGDKGTPTRVETALSAYVDGSDHSSVPCAQTSQTADAVEDDQSKTTGAAIGQAIEALYDQERLTASEILSPTSPTISASATDYRPDELLRIADSNPSEARGGVLVLIEVPPQSSAEDKAARYAPQCHTSLNDTKTIGISDASSEQNEQVGKWTRSKPRFSDNTSLLMDFLSRAQAKKAAKDDQSNVSARMISSRLSPRAALADITLSPPQPSELTNHPGTSPLKQRLKGLDDHDHDDDDDDDEEEEEEEEEEEGAEVDDEDDDGDEGDDGDEKLEEAAIETGSCRRSTRTRFSRPAKTAAMTRIPVRRADGTEPIVLQRSKAQELAIVTRANTRRNKGQAKPPKLTLKRLPAGDADEAIIAPRRAERDKARTVGWDKKLAYYMDPSESQEGEEEKRPRVRRLRKLGAVNGTPAPKKVIIMETSNNSSNENGAPNRRSKSKGRGAK